MGIGVVGGIVREQADEGAVLPMMCRNSVGKGIMAPSAKRLDQKSFPNFGAKIVGRVAKDQPYLHSSSPPL